MVLMAEAAAKVVATIEGAETEPASKMARMSATISAWH
jgi:hypothetical protein